MSRRLAIVFSLIVLGLMLNGCTKCGPIWDDWQAPKSCRSWSGRRQSRELWSSRTSRAWRAANRWFGAFAHTECF